MTLQFTKMVSVKSYQHIVEQIESAIVSGELRQGDRLPAEMKLKDMFATSRGSVREALRVLEQKGLVDIKTGVKGGAVVKEVNTSAISDSMALLIRCGKISLRHLAEFRQLLEGHAAERAAEIGRPEEVEELQTIINKIHNLLADSPEDWHDFHRLDAQFHRHIARMARNPLLEANLQTVHENIEHYFQRYLPFSSELLHDDYVDLRLICEAIAGGDSLEAGIRARQHVARFTDLMQMHADDDEG